MKDLIVIGSSGHCSVIIDIVESSKEYKIIGLIDDDKSIGTTFLGYKILGGVNDLERINEKYFCTNIFIAVGSNISRKKIHDSLGNKYEYVNLIHPKAILSKKISLGIGNVIMPGAVINSNSKIANFNIINTNAVIEHNTSIGSFSSIGPGACIAGGCNVGNNTMIALNATIIEKINIGNNTVVGAGSVVVKNCNSNSVYYGVPAIKRGGYDYQKNYLK